MATATNRIPNSPFLTKTMPETGSVDDKIVQASKAIHDSISKSLGARIAGIEGQFKELEVSLAVRLTKALESEFKSMMQQGLKELNERAENIKSQYAAETKAFSDNVHTHVSEQSSSLSKSLQDSYKQEVKAIQDSHRKHLEQVMTSHAAELKALKVDYDSSIKSIRAESNERFDSIQKSMNVSLGTISDLLRAMPVPRIENTFNVPKDAILVQPQAVSFTVPDGALKVELEQKPSVVNLSVPSEAIRVQMGEVNVNVPESAPPQVNVNVPLRRT